MLAASAALVRHAEIDATLLASSDAVASALSTTTVGAVIVEPRSHDSLEHVVMNAAEMLSPEITIDLYHGANVSVCALSRELCNLTSSGRLRLFKLDEDNLDGCSYSKLMTTKKFWQERGATDKTLVFQTDSILCKKSAYTVRTLRPANSASSRLR